MKKCRMRNRCNHGEDERKENMIAFLIVILGVLLPFCIMFVGMVTMIRSRNNETINGMVIGVILTAVGGLILVLVSIVLVHELMVHAPYFMK